MVSVGVSVNISSDIGQRTDYIVGRSLDQYASDYIYVFMSIYTILPASLSIDLSTHMGAIFVSGNTCVYTSQT